VGQKISSLDNSSPTLLSANSTNVVIEDNEGVPLVLQRSVVRRGMINVHWHIQLLSTVPSFGLLPMILIHSMHWNLVIVENSACPYEGKVLQLHKSITKAVDHPSISFSVLVWRAEASI